MIDCDGGAIQFQRAVRREGGNFNLTETVAVSVTKSAGEINRREGNVAVFAAEFLDIAEGGRGIDESDRKYNGCVGCAISIAIEALPAKTLNAVKVCCGSKYEIL